MDGLRCLENMGRLLGRENLIYRHAIRGINEGMNTDIEDAFASEYIFEAFAAEAVLHHLSAGAYVDPTDVKLHFKQEHRPGPLREARHQVARRFRNPRNLCKHCALPLVG